MGLRVLRRAAAHPNVVFRVRDFWPDFLITDLTDRRSAFDCCENNSESSKLLIGMWLQSGDPSGPRSDHTKSFVLRLKTRLTVYRLEKVTNINLLKIFQ